jgi:hypothetical protein
MFEGQYVTESMADKGLCGSTSVYGELTIAPVGWVAMMRKYRW